MNRTEAGMVRRLVWKEVKPLGVRGGSVCNCKRLDLDAYRLIKIKVAYAMIVAGAM